MIDEFDDGRIFRDDKRLTIAIFGVIREEHEVLTATSVRSNRLPFVEIRTDRFDGYLRIWSLPVVTC